MNSIKKAKSEAEIIDLGDKKFYKYSSPTHEFEVKKTVLHGRSPENHNKAFVESESFAIFVLSGEGEIFLDGKISTLQAEDVIYVLKGTTWYINGNLEYLVINVPVWKPEQMSEVDI